MCRVRRDPGAVHKTTLPTGQPLAGRWVRLDLLTEADLGEMYPILSDPAVYAHGYVMHHRPTSLDDARDLARSMFLAEQGQGGGRTAYAIRLPGDSDLGLVGMLVGTSALSEADLHNESIHIGSTLYSSRWWGTQVNPESKLLLMTHCFEHLVVVGDLYVFGPGVGPPEADPPLLVDPDAVLVAREESGCLHRTRRPGADLGRFASGDAARA